MAELDVAAMVVMVEDPADMVTMSMVSMFLTLITVLAPMSGTNSDVKDMIMCGGTGSNNHNVGTTSSLSGNHDNDNNNNGENEGQGVSSDHGGNNRQGFRCGAYGDHSSS